LKKIHLKYPVIVEGKYDKIKLSNILSSSVISIGGFSFMNDTKKKKLLSALSADTKLIILTDSDKAGAFIRSRLK
jgi:ribonuclease M5